MNDRRRRSTSATNQRHVQARRRLTMSSSRSRASSVPKRLGHGMMRRTRRSTRPRKATTTKNVSEQRLADAPAVVVVEPVVDGRARRGSRSNVATRVSRRSSRESSLCDSLTSDAASGSGLGHRGHGSPYSSRVLRSGSPSSVFQLRGGRAARRYHRPLYVALGLDLALGLLDARRPRGVSSTAARSVVARCAGFRGDRCRISRSSDCRWRLALVSLHERRWGFSTQSTRRLVRATFLRNSSSAASSQRCRSSGSSPAHAHSRRGGRPSPRRRPRALVLASASSLRSCSSRSSTGSSRSPTRSSRTSCARSPSGRACRCATCSWRTRAGGRRR